MTEKGLVFNPDNDLLQLYEDQEISQMIKDEIILFSDKVNKINKYFIAQERVILVTNQAIYNFKEKELKRRIEYSIVKGITTVDGEGVSFIIHCNDFEHDYFYSSPRHLKIIQMINIAHSLHFKRDISIYIVEDKSIGDYVTLKKEKKKDVDFSRMPTHLQPISFDEFLTGNKKANQKEFDIQASSIDDLEILKVIGKGAFSKVFLVRGKGSSSIFAMKIYRKFSFIENPLLAYIKNEKDILFKCKSKFITHLFKVMQNEVRIFYILEYKIGGDLYSYLKTVSEEESNKYDLNVFIISNIVLGLEELERRNVLYRDLKLENVLIDMNGYLSLSDFGISKFLPASKDKTYTFCGSPEYLSPEIIVGEGYDKKADYWALGILIYELFFGIPPFYSTDIMTLYQLICHASLKFVDSNPITEETKSIIIRCLNKNQDERLGYSGVSEIKNHYFFSELNFDQIEKEEMKSPLKISVSNSIDTKYFDYEYTSEIARLSVIDVTEIKKIGNNKSLFSNF